eukprot:TRINITY_DN8963_c1_g1_i3.p1 TRINITY_DN8963_c1_g1~~TRINITY_DN8963_c1_g1_i3.p1  ORF type:complete len:597 (-),score=69.59 TRINITY_DN8963_c1_g1_i3:7-1797(-)
MSRLPGPWIKVFVDFDEAAANSSHDSIWAYYNIETRQWQNDAPGVEVDWKLVQLSVADGNGQPSCSAYVNIRFPSIATNHPPPVDDGKTGPIWRNMFLPYLRTSGVDRARQLELEKNGDSQKQSNALMGVWIEGGSASEGGHFYWLLQGDGTLLKHPSKPPQEPCNWRCHESPDGTPYFEDLSTREVHWTIPGLSLPWGSKEQSCGPGKGVSLSEKVKSEPRMHGFSWVVEGVAVEILGLQHDTHFNGLGCNIRSFPRGLVEVQFPDHLGAEFIELDVKHLGPLGKLQVVRIEGLSGKRELNGTLGFVEDFLIGERGNLKYHVRLFSDGRKLAIAGDRLRPLNGLLDLNLVNAQGWLQWKKSEIEGSFMCSEGKLNRYHILVPPKFQEQCSTLVKKWPLMIWLCGTGGGTFCTQTKKTLHTPGIQYAFQNFVVISPTCEWQWTDHAKRWVNELAQRFAASSFIDHRRVYLTGMSMGGMGTWELASLAPPGLYAAIAPVGAYHKKDYRDTISANIGEKKLPVLVVQSVDDDTCRIEPESQLWELLLSRGVSCLQIELAPSCDHSYLFDRAYCDCTFLYDWLLVFQTAVDSETVAYDV